MNPVRARHAPPVAPRAAPRERPPAGLIAIDPGYAKTGRGSACARFNAGRLVRVWFAREASPNIAGAGGLEGVTLIVAERPQVDGRSREIAPTLVRLAWEGALLAGFYAGAALAEVRSLSPDDWKGSTPKPVHHGRLWFALDAAEQAVLGGPATLAAIDAAKRAGAAERWRKPGGAYYPASFLAHNLLDAAALGAFILGRLAK